MFPAGKYSNIFANYLGLNLFLSFVSGYQAYTYYTKLSIQYKLVIFADELVRQVKDTNAQYLMVDEERIKKAVQVAERVGNIKVRNLPWV